MGKELCEITEDTIGEVIEELDAAFYDIPFENSDFQNRAFVMAAQQTPGRAYRAIGLRMFAKLRAVKSHAVQRERNQIDVDEKRYQITQPNTSPFDKRRLELDILEIEDGKAYGDKLLNDALRELNCLYAEFKNLPRYTREGFEREEEEHFFKRLDRAVKVGGGAQESLINMKLDLPEWDHRIAKAIEDHVLKFLVVD